VTVIATGFGDLEHRYAAKYSPSGAPLTQPIQAAATRPVESPQAQPPAPPAQSRMFPNKPVRRLGLLVDDSLDIPTFKRRAEEGGFGGPTKLAEAGEEEDKLDIPTFLRKNAD